MRAAALPLAPRLDALGGEQPQPPGRCPGGAHAHGSSTREQHAGAARGTSAAGRVTQLPGQVRARQRQAAAGLRQYECTTPRARARGVSRVERIGSFSDDKPHASGEAPLAQRRRCTPAREALGGPESADSAAPNTPEGNGTFDGSRRRNPAHLPPQQALSRLGVPPVTAAHPCYSSDERAPRERCEAPLGRRPAHPGRGRRPPLAAALPRPRRARRLPSKHSATTVC